MFVPLAELQLSLEVGESAGGMDVSTVQMEIFAVTVALGSRVLLMFSLGQMVLERGPTVPRNSQNEY